MKRLLVIQLERLGDLIQTTPLLQELISSGAWQTIDLLAPLRAAEAIKGLPGLGEVHVVPESAIASLSGLIRRGRQASQGAPPAHALVTGVVRHPTVPAEVTSLLAEMDLPEYDTVLNLTPAALGSWLAENVRAKHRVGAVLREDGEWLHLGDWPAFLVALVGFRELNRFNLVDLWRGLAPGSTPARPGSSAWVSRAEDSGVHLPDGRLVALNPGASKSDRRWSPEGFAHVADELTAAGFTPLLVGSPADEAICERVSAACRRPIANLAGRNDIRQMATLLSQVELLVSNDTGAAHISAAVGTPVVTVALPVSFRETAPWGEGHVVLEPGGERDERALDRVPATAVAAAALMKLGQLSPEALRAELERSGTRAWATSFLPSEADPLGGVTCLPLHQGSEGDKHALVAEILRHVVAAELMDAADDVSISHLPDQLAQEEASHTIAAFQACAKRLNQLGAIAAEARRFAGSDKRKHVERAQARAAELDRELKALLSRRDETTPLGVVLALLDWRLRFLLPAPPKKIYESHRQELLRASAILSTTAQLVGMLDEQATTMVTCVP